MPAVSAALFVIAMLCLAAAVIAVVSQIVNHGVKGVRALPALPLMAGYVVAFVLWLAL